MPRARSTGSFVRVRNTRLGERYRAFVPAPLPPTPALALSGADEDLLRRANDAVSRLDGVTRVLPNTSLFVYAYVRKEALVSSQIEGTQSSLVDLLLHENDELPGVPLEDVREVSDYIAAMELGLARLRTGVGLSFGLLRDVHRVLLRGRGGDKAPGELRRGVVWIGGARPSEATFVPPPARRVGSCVEALEQFLRTPSSAMAPLLKAALAHVQLETIHPFRDGNGRLGRALIALSLAADGVLSEPLLYVSLYLKLHRAEYYARLQAVRTEGDWEGWVRFFLEGVVVTARDAIATTRRILALFEAHRRELAALGRASGTALGIHAYLERRPIVTIPTLATTLGLSYPTVATGLTHLQKAGIVRELTGFRRNRVFAYAPYVAILAEGTDPLARRGS